ncbi:hypothetical protein V1477_010076 [Vespula maculifrons]|uniref:Uncharacterized protein n=1 Tax=Vespula maculifrons TaxID=7453 RepID=A0ABD2CBM6_VESMC
MALSPFAMLRKKVDGTTECLQIEIVKRGISQNSSNPGWDVFRLSWRIGHDLSSVRIIEFEEKSRRLNGVLRLEDVNNRMDNLEIVCLVSRCVARWKAKRRWKKNLVGQYYFTANEQWSEQYTTENARASKRVLGSYPTNSE